MRKVDGGNETEKLAREARGDVEMPNETYLRFSRSSIIVAVGSGAQRGTRPVCARGKASPLCQVLLTLRLANLDLLLLATAAEFFGLEGALRLEVGAAMLGNVAISHVCGWSDLFVEEKWSC